ncbi:MAG: MBOAT family protein [Lachnospiraceae bacterium]|nr:MBOAT family protein [Lachnospiraceae bacterium]
MLFNSYIFILFFLPFCILGYFVLNHFEKYTLAQIFLVGMSLWFYGYFNPGYLLILTASVLLNYVFYLLIRRNSGNKYAKILMISGVLLNIGILLYFKYMDFFIDNINGIFKTDIPFLYIVLPLGISFFTFQQISFIVDAYRGEIPEYRFWEYAGFVTYFPQLVAGPIVTHDELVPQFMDKGKKKFDSENMAQGIYMFTLGLAKKILLADMFGKLVSYGYATVDGLNSVTAIITMLAYTFQIYFDFSGYSDMAIGIGKMMNIDLPQNFKSPYKALTITEFWDRWHMTLTRFFTKYVYIPLGGNRKGAVRTYVNVFIVYLISGFWHGASWNFVFWGVMHGLFVIFTRRFKRFFDRISSVLNWLITFLFVNVTWVFFRAETFTQAVALLKKVFTGGVVGFDLQFIELLRSVEIVEVLSLTPMETIYPPFVLTAFFVIAFLVSLGSKNAYEKMQRFRPTFLRMVTTLFLLFWSIFSFAGISTFLYFNF